MAKSINFIEYEKGKMHWLSPPKRDSGKLRDIVKRRRQDWINSKRQQAQGQRARKG
jgi:hypothetical protein